MRIFFAISILFLFIAVNALAQVECAVSSRAVADAGIAGDNTIRYYRLAIPVTRTAYIEDFDSNYAMVLSFWHECETFVNKMFVPLGLCFDVVEDECLVMRDFFPNEEYDDFIFDLQANGTVNANNIIAVERYDVGMWVHHRDVWAENSGLSINGGAYDEAFKASGYAKADKWVVAHELGHMFGAPHTTPGEGSLMDSEGGDFFSYPSIKIIRETLLERGAGTAFQETKVVNSVPEFVYADMKDTYIIPAGACFAIPVSVKDADGHLLTYSAIGCNSRNVDNITEGGDYPHFASLIPRPHSLINYRPAYVADMFYDDFYYIKEGTDIPSMPAGLYSLAFIVNDVPASTEYDYLVDNPFYSNYSVWDATVQIVEGIAFEASLSPKKSSYSACEQITVSWGVNKNYFTDDSRLRISISTDYGNTFDYVLAESVPALDGHCMVTLPNFNIGNVEVDFATAVRSMPAGVIRIEEVGGVAYTLTALSPEQGGSFNITGGVETSVGAVPSISSPPAEIYDLRGRHISADSTDNLVPGLYIINGKKVAVE